jgi:dihydrofolate reductase
MRTFEISLKNNQLPYGGWKVPQFVVTGTAQDAQTIDGLVFTFVTGGVQPALEMARAAAGGKNVSLLGASVDQQCLKAQLVDEIVIHLAPILLGEGRRLFDHLGAQPVVLERTAAVTTAGITSLRFRVIR